MQGCESMQIGGGEGAKIKIAGEKPEEAERWVTELLEIYRMHSAIVDV